MSATRAWREDALGLAWLAGCAALVTLPGWARGHDAFLDNPAHLAEIAALAQRTTNGWVDVAFCGFDVTLFHSPLLYGGAALLVRAGIPITLLYPVCALAGWALPALACFAVMRGHLAAGPRALLACSLLLRGEGIVGVQSPLGGMWPFGIALACTALLLARVAARTSDRVAVLLAGLVVGTHVLGLALVAAVALACVLVRGRDAIADLRALALGVALGAGAWLPFVLSSGWMRPPAMTLGLGELAPPLLSIEGLGVLGALLPGLAGLAGVLGIGRLRERTDPLPLFGAVLAGMAGLLLAASLTLAPRALGIYALRAIPVLRVALVLAAIPFASWAWERLASRARIAATALAVVATLALSLGWGRTLAVSCLAPSDPETQEIAALWAWMRTHRTDAWGRVYVQDTFRARGATTGARSGHVLARTHDETGVDQLGAWYAAFPAPTSAWTRGEHDRLFDHDVELEGDLDRVLGELERVGATHLVLVDAHARELARMHPALEARFERPHLALFERRGAVAAWVSAGPGARVTRVERPAPGQTLIEVTVQSAPARIVVRDAYHPWWALRGAGRLGADAHDLIAISDLPRGIHRLELVYAPPRWPWLVSLAALVIASWRTRRERQA